MKKLIILISVLCAAAFVSAQSKTSEIKGYLGERYNSVAAPGNWDFYFQTVTIIRKSDGTKTFPQLLASAPNWSDGSDGALEQIRWNGKLLTDMRKQQTQVEKPIQKPRMVSNYVGQIDSMQIAEQIDRVVKDGPGWIAGIWNSWWFNSLAILFMFCLSTLYFLSKACLNEVKINNAGIVTFGRWMYIFGCWVAGIQWFVALFACTFLLFTFMALFISGTWQAFFFSYSVWSLALTGLVFKIIVGYTLALFDKLTPEPPSAIDQQRFGITFNGGNALQPGKSNEKQNYIRNPCLSGILCFCTRLSRTVLQNRELGVPSGHRRCPYRRYGTPHTWPKKS